MKKIPKIIHYCWFGGNPLPEMAKKCIESWKKYCPDYEIIEWNESNFDLNCCQYVTEAYKAQKWAFVSDVARLYALVNYGGIYMDTDVEVLKPLDDILEYEAVSGFEAIDRIPTGLMACQKEFPLFKELLADYDKRTFIKTDGSLDTTTNVVAITNICLQHGLLLNNLKQTVVGFTLFPSDFFCPKNYATGELKITKNTYTIHHFDGSWLADEDKYAYEIYRKAQRYFPDSIAKYISKFISVSKYRGIYNAFNDSFKFITKRHRM